MVAIRDRRNSTHVNQYLEARGAERRMAGVRDPKIRYCGSSITGSFDRTSKPGLSMLVPPGPFAPRISNGLRPIAEWNGIVVCAAAHGGISPCGTVAGWNGIVVCAAAHGGIPAKRKSGCLEAIRFGRIGYLIARETGQIIFCLLTCVFPCLPV